jgi:hypothetical protein
MENTERYRSSRASTSSRCVVTHEIDPGPEINMVRIPTGQRFRTRSNTRAKDGEVTYTPSRYGKHPLFRNLPVHNFVVDMGASSHIINDARMVTRWTSEKQEQCKGAIPGMAGTSVGRGDCTVMIYNKATKKHRRQILRDCAIIPGARKNLISGPQLEDDGLFIYTKVRSITGV